MAPTQGIGLAEVARVAGVSVATVSNALNRPEIVAVATRDRVFEAIRELDFVPNRAAATLRRGTNHLIALFVPEVANAFYSEIVSAVADEAARHDFVIGLCVTHDEPEREVFFANSLAEQRAAAAIVVPITADAPRLSQLRRVGTRLVLLDRIAANADGCSVGIDDVLGGELAVRHLLSSGAAAVTLVNGPHSVQQCADRHAGALRALAAAGLPASALHEIVVDAMTVDAGRRVGRQLAAGPNRPAVFCVNDQLAVGIIGGLREHGVDVPSQALVVGYGDQSLALDGPVPLTSVAQPTHQMGVEAVRCALAEVNEGAEHVHRTVQLRPRLVVRGSAPAIPEPGRGAPAR
ncbi:LacI family DNA-binding transcriptional regulator [Agromyces seonyuensis]|uniref:LacI family DNA-binding transcriptional regulator n=1 Tax=Agromyces seonyuensis TaxID=2662446 RepID=A0A6I4P1N1_9MICO|nr:LacI family DNA-binding transcriptional regulator [Agromyces seonyuensis]MWB97137.1 LacI family DNA-binding transcriptional regulator [Agromyces seonyuensis]